MANNNTPHRVHSAPQAHDLRPKPLPLAISSIIASGLLWGAAAGTARAGGHKGLPESVNHAMEAQLKIPELANPGGHATGTFSADGNRLTINQFTDKAVMEWNSFNIDAGKTVKFVQPTNGVALNNIHQTDPSKIFGTLTANGQVYLVNQNGFVFGKGSQFNVNALVATTLNISEDAFRRGITKVFDQDGSAALQGKGEFFLKDAGGQFVRDQNGDRVPIRIIVQPGAKITTRDANGKAQPGGRVILAAPVITNGGTIDTPQGQTVLAAAKDKVYLQEANADSKIRGLLVEVETGGKVTNDKLGKILADQGNASLLGFAVNQNGLVSATSSVRLNGSVRLQAGEGHQRINEVLKPVSAVRKTEQDDGLGVSGTVKLGADSVTEVALDANKSKKAVAAQTQEQSLIDISGHKVLLEQDAQVLAHSGKVKVTAAADLQSFNAKDGSRIYMEAGSKIDVSGVKGVSKSMESNVLKVELRSNELKDSPLQRKGVLYAKKVLVDVRDLDAEGHIPIADVSGARDRILTNIDERSTQGGSIDLQSAGDTVVKSGASLDVSGGSVVYRSGYIRTTQLTSNGRVFGIADADPNRKYDGLFNPKPGRFEAGYTEGQDAGQLNIKTYDALLDGSVNAATIDGARQRLPEDKAAAGEWSLDLLGQAPSQSIFFDRQPAITPIGMDDPFPQRAGPGEGAAALLLDAGLIKKSGARNITLSTAGSIVVHEDAKIEAPTGGSLTFNGGDIHVQGQIIAPAGTVNLEATPGGSETSGAVQLGSSALIDARGQWINDQGGATGTLAYNGGKVSIKTHDGDLKMDAGSRIDVSGGAWLTETGKLKDGKGGAIALSATGGATNLGASLFLDGQLDAYGLKNGGSLSLNSNEVIIGGAQDAVSHPGSELSPLLLAPEFFRQGGFANYTLTSNLFGVKVAGSAEVRPLQQNLQLSPGYKRQGTGSDLRQFSSVVTLPDAQRHAANLTLSLQQGTTKERTPSVLLEQGAKIVTDPLGKVNLFSDTSIFVNGEIVTPGGQIGLTVTTPTNDGGYFASQGIWLGETGHLSAPGVLMSQPNNQGLRKGDVLQGGSINLTANRGYIVTAAGSRMDADGSSAILDLPAQNASGLKLKATTVVSEGGEISLTAAEGLLLDGGMSAKGGGKGTAGGRLSVELNKDLRNKQPQNPIPGGEFPDDDQSGFEQPLPRVLTLTTDETSVLPAGMTQGSDVPKDFYGQGILRNAQINAGGFGSLSLRANGGLNEATSVGDIRFQGDVKLDLARQIILDAPKISWAEQASGDSGQVRLNAAYVAMGSTQAREAPTAVSGKGQLGVDARAIELVGGLGLRGFGNVVLSSTGDLRVRGVKLELLQRDYKGGLDVAGNLNILADQVYPATLTDYSINVGGTGDKTVTLQGTGGKSANVLSAAGALSIHAPNIRQDGVIKAPFGTLTLDATDKLELGKSSVTSVSGNGLIVPFGQVQGGLDWLFPLDARGELNLIIDSPPEKRITLKGDQVALDKGGVVDISGGGNLKAFEYIKGPGGSQDVLNPNAPGYRDKFAVLPGFSNYMTPYDPSEFPASGLQVGDSVYLSGGGGLAAGHYTLLPARYALLPGAYLVTPNTKFADPIPGEPVRQVDGSPVVAGRFEVAGTDIADSRWSGFVVEPGNIARTRSEYQEYSGNQFFAGKAKASGIQASQLPRDAGSLSISAANGLTLGANLKASPGSRGAGGNLDIDAQRLVVVATPEQVGAAQPGTINLLADDLNKLKVENLLLGGTRSRDGNAQRLQISSKSVAVASGAQLKGKDITLAASEEVRVASGALVQSAGKSNQPSGTVRVENAAGNSDGALLQVSDAGLSSMERDQGVSGNTGTLTVEQGATLKAQGSILLDSTRDTTFAGRIDMQGGDLALKSSQISLGAAPAGSGGLVLSASQLADLKVDRFNLTSLHDLNLYGDVALQAKQLSIDAAALKGFDNAGQSARISADILELGNSSAVQSATPGSGSGSLALNARLLQLGAGDYAMQGFSNVTLTGTDAIQGQGRYLPAGGSTSVLADPGKLTVSGDLTLSAGHLSGGHGATTVIDASGHQLTVGTVGGGDRAKAAGLGASWDLRADRIDVTGRFDLPSGILRMQALQGDIDFASKAAVDVSGRAIAFNELTKYSTAGSIVLRADQGNISLGSGAGFDLRGDSAGGDAGSLEISAANGRFDWQGQIRSGAKSGQRQGQFSLDSQDFGGFSALNTQLAAAGFSESLNLRQRQGDVVIAAGDSVVAKNFNLAVDQGAVQINGQIDASGDQGGAVSIRGHNGIAMTQTSLIDAHGKIAGNNGGRVLLDTVHADDGGSGQLNLGGGTISVRAGAGGAGGQVHLRTGRDDTGNTVAVVAIDTEITGASRAMLEATRVYADQTDITASAIATWQTDTQTFMQNAPSLTGQHSAAVDLLPGIEIRGSGDLNLVDKWDFMATDVSGNKLWRYGDQPGFLTLTAGGNLNIRASLTDAFAPSAVPDPYFLGNPVYEDMLQTGNSWSYRLVAGGDIALDPSFQDPRFGVRQVKVRTGTGDIELQAGQDVVFKPAASKQDPVAAIYTVGRPGDATSPAEARRYGSLNEVMAAFVFAAEYPTQGGNLSITAGRDIAGVTGNQLMTEWLVRTGNWSANATHTDERPTMWGINLAGDLGSASDANFDGIMDADGLRSFKQNVGALGGGDVTVKAGGDIRNLSVMIPTTGKQVGDVQDPNDPFNFNFSSNQILVQGGGDLNVAAGGDILGGVYYAGKGTGHLSAGGSLGLGDLASGAKLGPTLGLGDAVFDLTARLDVSLGAAFNPTLLVQNPAPDMNSYFFTYSPDSAVNLTSLAGDVVLQNDVDALINGTNKQGGDSDFALSVLPGTLRAAALSGDFRLQRNANLFPSAHGQMELLAANNIGTGSTGNPVLLNMSDADPALLPSTALPAASLSGQTAEAKLRFTPIGAKADLIHAATPVHTADNQSVWIIARDGDIAFADSNELTVLTPKRAVVEAGGDIRDLTLKAQNLKDTDITRIQAGGNVQYRSKRNPATGAIINQDQRQIELAGPGQLQLLAGKDVDLGASGGISTIGNLSNTSIGAERGADVTVMAGLSGKVDYDAFIKEYLKPGSQFLKGVEVTVNGTRITDEKLKYEDLLKWPDEVRQRAILGVLFEQLRIATTLAATNPAKAKTEYDRGYAAINKLFPDGNYKGDVKLFFSKIKTISGGDINLVVPGGLVNAGLAGSFSGAKDASQLGIVVQGDGNLNAMVKGDFQVNQSRVFAMDGGSITIWSSDGSIDAGRGAKAAIAAPPPITTFDDKGNLVTTFPPIVSGSGIQTLVSTPGKSAGNVILAAPKGIVNAGEAGINSGGKVIIAATAVVGASNIQASGGSIGVPTAVAAPVMSAGADSAASSAAKSASQMSNDENDKATNAASKDRKNAGVSIYSAKVVRYGQCTPTEARDGKKNCRGGDSGSSAPRSL